MATRNTEHRQQGGGLRHSRHRASTATTSLAVWQAAAEAVRRARAGEGPTLIESSTYRQVGHQEGDPVVGWYRTQEEWDCVDEALPGGQRSASGCWNRARARRPI